MMNRRSLLKGLLAAAVAPVAVKFAPYLPERVNRLFSVHDIQREALRVLHVNTVFMQSTNRQFDPSFADIKAGDTIRIRLPKNYGVS